MGVVLADRSVLLDILTEDPRWHARSSDTLAHEVSARLTRIEDLDEALDPGCFQRIALPWEAAFLAGKTFLLCRKRGGPRRAPLPDFFIGAHAAVGNRTLLTRDPARYRTYFPAVRLIAPRPGEESGRASPGPAGRRPGAPGGGRSGR